MGFFADVLVSSEPSSLYIQELESTLFCIAPAGWELWSVRFFEAIIHGCIPVLIGQHIRLPFESFIDYRRISVKVQSHPLTFFLAPFFGRLGRTRSAVSLGFLKCADSSSAVVLADSPPGLRSTAAAA